MPRLKVIGVGGAGGNAIANMAESTVYGLEIAAANTDLQALDAFANSPDIVRLPLGRGVSGGFGAGADPRVGEAAALESEHAIREYINGTDMLFIAAGMGGGTGTGAAPVIAEFAREQGVTVVAVVTRPFDFEGSHRERVALSGIERLRSRVDTYVVIHNQHLFRIISDKTTFKEAFKMADDVLIMAIRSITELITKPGLINLDFADIRTVICNMGRATIGCGEASGKERASIAADNAMNNPLLEENCLQHSRSALVNITGSSDIGLMEIELITDKVKHALADDANLILGTTIDDSLEDKIRVSVLATSIADDKNDDARRDGSLAKPSTQKTAKQQHSAPFARPSNFTPKNTAFASSDKKNWQHGNDCNSNRALNGAQSVEKKE